jgi:hypothetical protein
MCCHTIWKGDHPSIIPARFGLTWFNGFKGEDLKVKVYDGSQVMSKNECSIDISFTFSLYC